MPDNEARVTARVTVEGLQEATQQFNRFTGTVNQSSRLLSQQGGADRLMQETRVGGLSPGQIESLLQRTRSALSNVYTDMDRILGSGSPAARHYHELLNRGYAEPYAMRRTVQGGLPGAERLEQMGMLRREAGGLEGLERRLEVLNERQADRQENTLNQWLPRLSRTIASMGALVGVGSATAIASQSLNRAVEYGITAADIRGFIGRGAGDIGDVGLRAAGPYGLYPAESVRIAGSLRAGGMRGGRERQAGMVDEFAGLGMFFGMGREGFAQAGQEAVGRGSFQNLESYRRFGYVAGATAQNSGLDPAQRSFLFEQSKSTYETMSKLYGGRPLNEDSFFIGVNTLMESLRGLGLPAGGAPIALEAMGGFARGMSPIGKGFGDVIRQGAMLGINNGGDYLSTQRQINDLLRDPNAFIDVLQRLGGMVGIQRGSRPNQGQLNSLMALVSTAMPQLLDPIGRMNVAGKDIGDLMTMRPGQIPGNVNAIMASALKDTAEMSEDRWRKEDIKWVKDEIKGMGETLREWATEVKKILSPGGAAAVSIGTGLLPGALSFLGARAGAGGLGALAGGATGTILGWGSAALGTGALAYGAGSLINNYLPNIGGGLYDMINRQSGNKQIGMQAAIAAAQRHGIDPLLALGIAEVESGNDPFTKPNARSNAAGLMQIMPHMQKAFRMKNVYDPDENAEVGMKILMEQYKTHGSIAGALSGYGGYGGELGPGALAYIAKVEAAIMRLASALEDNSSATEGNTRITAAEAGRSIARIKQSERPKGPAR